MTLNLALVGAAGTMGRQIIKQISSQPRFKLVAALESPAAVAQQGQIESSAIRLSSDLESGIRQAEGVIDFSTPSSSVESMRLAAKFGKPILIGTTGHNADQMAAIQSLAVDVPTLVCANTSIGIWALRELSKMAKTVLGDQFDIEIFEFHHRRKIDAPSGTALTLASDLVGATTDLLKVDRSSRSEARTTGEVGLASARGGDVCGEHTVFFVGHGERLELCHRVWDRAVFASGALRLFDKLYSKSKGLYSIADLM